MANEEKDNVLRDNVLRKNKTEKENNQKEEKEINNRLEELRRWFETQGGCE